MERRFNLGRIVDISQSTGYACSFIPSRKRCESIVLSKELSDRIQNRVKVVPNMLLCRHTSSVLSHKELKQHFKLSTSGVFVLGDLSFTAGTILTYGDTLRVPEEHIFISKDVLLQLGCSDTSCFSDIEKAFKTTATLTWLLDDFNRYNSKVVYEGPVILGTPEQGEFFQENTDFVFDSDVKQYLNSFSSTDVTVEELTGIVDLLQSPDADTVKLGCKLFLTAHMQAVPVTATFIIKHYRSSFRYVRYVSAFTSLSVALNLGENFFERGQNIPLEQCLQNIPSNMSYQDQQLLQGLVRAEIMNLCRPVFDTIVLE